MVSRGVVLVVLAVSPVYAATYVGAAACVKCHAAEARQWSGSRHSKMLQPATALAVKGDFTLGAIQLRGMPYRLAQRNGAYYITESYLTGQPQEHRVDFTLGNRRIQHYLTRLPSGRIVVLPPSWDVIRKQWFHNFDIGDPDESGEVEVQVWNKQCFSCHVSQEEKGFDIATGDYKTAWLDFGTNCERCHGPGSDHMSHYSAAQKPSGPVTDIILQTRLDPTRNTGTCAQCHSFRDIFVPGYSAGANYYDFFYPILEYSQPEDKDPAYWPDGRTRRFSNDAFGLWQSQCYLKGGVTCVQCHAAAHETEIERNPQLRPDASALCTRCHEAIGKATTAHTHHAAESPGSSCVECHMPRTVYSIKAEIRDHSMSVPAPENTARHAIPNACNLCHKERDAAWSIARMNAWWPAASRQKWIRRADAFAAARRGEAAAVPLLTAIANNPAEGPLPRANAFGYLSRYSAKAPAAFAAFTRALADPDPLVRATAALRIAAAPADRPAAVAALTRALADPVATVRLGAGVSLVGMGVAQLPGEDGRRFDAVKALYQSRAALSSDDSAIQLGAGRFYLLAGDPARAIGALETSLKLNPDTLAEYLLAYAHAERAEYSSAREILQEIPSTDPQYSKAQELLKAIEGR
jgi:predicted CXXCH cytochrome family protein